MMDRIWTPIVEPLLDLLGPKAIVAFPSPVHLLDERIGLYSRRTGADFRSIEAIGDGDSGGAEGPEGNTVNLRSAPIFGSFGASPDAVLIDGFEAWQRALPHLRALAARSHNDRQTRLPVVIVWDSGLLEDSVARSHPDQDVSENLSPDPVPEMIEFVSDSTAEIDVVDVAGVEGMGLLYATSVERDAPDVFEFITGLSSAPMVGELLHLGDSLKLESIALESARDRYERLRSRRSVRLALSLAEGLRPALRLARRLRGQDVQPHGGGSPPAADNADVGSPNVVRRMWRRPPSRRDQRRLAKRLGRSRPGSNRVTGPTVSILILTRDGAPHLRRLLPSLDKTTYRSFEVVVVDNGSRDCTEKILAGEWSYPLRVIRNEGNVSFAEGTNRAASVANGDYLLLLNNDIEPIAPGWLGAMVDTLESDNRAGACGAVLVLPVREEPETDLTVQHTGIHFSFSRMGVRGVNSSSPDALDPDLAGVREVPAATGAALLVSHRLYDEVGGLDEGYVYGTEDLDLCLKLRETGRSIVVTGQAVLFHYESATQNRVAEDIIRMNRSGNRQRLMETWGARLTRSVQRDRLTGTGAWTEPRRRTVAITLTRNDVAEGWGDFYTAHELGDRFSAQGWNVVYAERYEDHWYELGEEVDLLISLLDSYDVRNAPPGAVNLAWVRNWVDRWLDRPWFEAYDMVIASSHKAASLIAERSRFDPPVVPLATNPERFAPGPPNPTFVCDYAFTGNNWGHGRELIPMIDVHPGERFLLFGKGWDQDPRMVRYWQGHLDYNLLPDLYRSTKVVLDDTAGPTSPYAFLNGRVFDGLAAGALVLTDNVEGSAEMFDGLLPSYGSGEELRAQLDLYLKDEDARQRLVEELRARVLENHTYDTRPDQFIELALEHVEGTRAAIKIGVPDEASKPQWGDTHFGNALAAALTQQGMPTEVHILPEWDLPENQDVDVVIHIRGLTTYAPKPAHVNVLWIISHPESVSARECEKYDLVFVASLSHAEWLESKIDRPVIFMPQATDERRFHPAPPDPDIESEVLFVGNTRDHGRPVVEWALDAGLPLTVYGQGWDGHLPDTVLRGSYFPNEHLGRLYSSAKVVLNDHWPDMREAGFVSNRVLDALACGTAVVSDHVEGMEEILGDLVPTYASRNELESVIVDLLDDGNRRRLLGDSGAALVANEHTFSDRARQIIAHARPLLRRRKKDLESGVFELQSPGPRNSQPSSSA